MKLAVSNIAWSADEEPRVAEEMARLGVRYVEVAPTKVFANPAHVTAREARDYSESWAALGITICSFQSMLFGRPDLQIFAGDRVREMTRDYLSRFIELAGLVGATRLVFGSPQNRFVPDGMHQSEIDDIADDFFGSIGSIASSAGVVFCIEPNPAAYGCNFVTNAAQGLALVERLDHPGIGLHLDAAGMTLAGDNLASSIIQTGDRLKHFHISAPHLGAIEDSEVDHAAAAAALNAIDYGGYLSIEMRPGSGGEGSVHVRHAVELATRYYLC